MVGLGVVDHGALEVLREDVAHDTDREVGLLEDERGRLGLPHALLEHLVELEQVLQLALEVLAGGAVRRGADDRPAAVEVELLGLLAQAVALLVLEPPRDADSLAGGRVDHVAAGDGDLHREPGALGLQRVLDDLDDDLLPGREQVGDPRPRGSGPSPAAHLLLAGDDDLVDVQEAVLVEADVDEGGLEPGQDVVDLALVDVADDRPAPAALEVDLRDAVSGRNLGLLLTPPAAGLGRSLGIARRLQHGDTGFPAVDRDQHLLSH